MKWFRFNCPWCGVELRTPETSLGQVVACPNLKDEKCGRPSRDNYGRPTWAPLQIRLPAQLK